MADEVWQREEGVGQPGPIATRPAGATAVVEKPAQPDPKTV